MLCKKQKVDFRSDVDRSFCRLKEEQCPIFTFSLT